MYISRREKGTMVEYAYKIDGKSRLQRGKRIVTGFT